MFPMFDISPFERGTPEEIGGRRHAILCSPLTELTGFIEGRR